MACPQFKFHLINYDETNCIFLDFFKIINYDGEVPINYKFNSSITRSEIEFYIMFKKEGLLFPGKFSNNDLLQILNDNSIYYDKRMCIETISHDDIEKIEYNHSFIAAAFETLFSINILSSCPKKYKSCAPFSPFSETDYNIIKKAIENML
jgi:hypothetical protein